MTGQSQCDQDVSSRSGYPAKMVGDQIPLCERVVALADVYDALTSKRVYKDAFGQDIAKKIILNEAGTHFDPDVVDSFIQNEDKFLSIRYTFAEVQRAAA
jgi:putative two-component system response regulator